MLFTLSTHACRITSTFPFTSIPAAPACPPPEPLYLAPRCSRIFPRLMPASTADLRARPVILNVSLQSDPINATSAPRLMRDDAADPPKEPTFEYTIIQSPTLTILARFADFS